MFHSCTHKDTRNRGNSRGFTCDWCRLCYFVPRNWRVNARSGGKTAEPARLAIEVRANLFANWSFNYFFSWPAYGSVFSSPCLAFYFFIPSFFTLFFFSLFTSRFTVLGFYPSSEIVDHFVSSILDFTLSSMPPLLLFSSVARFFSLSSDPVNQFFLAGY